ncbi:anthrone oxygenase family protein [Streptomyces sp. MJP52]|uniref:anthrone oxygenase family protein n=1 Tax=Streptomyces sp. MJP52 TaxID=2940555 RepID=UPI002475EEFD|nr:anthrone oxygenase family protein [Streptomyces sp. MJP52]MDH6223208.1 putative membrane protein [Streptomyces sp. MJP52]
MDTVRLLVLVAATVTTGLVAGLFYGFSIAVMPGLARTGDRTLVDAMRRINAAILNGWFLLGYVGALLFDALALVLFALHEPSRAAVGPVAASTALYLAAVVLTARVNIPLNDALEEAGPPDAPTGPAAARQDFERPWVRANHWRTLLCTAALAALCWALAAHGAAA